MNALEVLSSIFPPPFAILPFPLNGLQITQSHYVENYLTMYQARYLRDEKIQTAMWPWKKILFKQKSQGNLVVSYMTSQPHTKGSTYLTDW